MKRSVVILKDIDNKDKTIEIGEPFLRDGTFWLTSRIGKDIVINMRLDSKEIEKLRNFLKEYFGEAKK